MMYYKSIDKELNKLKFLYSYLFYKSYIDIRFDQDNLNDDQKQNDALAVNNSHQNTSH